MIALGSVTLVRLALPLLLWWQVFWGYVINVVLDSVDGDILARFGVRRDFYQEWDKWMDLWFSLAIGWYVWTGFERDLIWWILGIVLVWRILGTVLFVLTKKEWILILFPHLQWKLFFIALVFPSWYEVEMVLPAPWPLLLMVLGVTIVFEWILHVAKWDTTALLLGIKRKW